MSARDVLREAMTAAMYAQEPKEPFEVYADAALDALAAHPVELLALLAEPKVCETCGGRGTDACGISDAPCDICHGTGSVAVDVLDLLVQARLAHRFVLSGGNYPDEGGPTCYTAIRAKDDTP